MPSQIRRAANESRLSLPCTNQIRCDLLVVDLVGRLLRVRGQQIGDRLQSNRLQAFCRLGSDRWSIDHRIGWFQKEPQSFVTSFRGCLRRGRHGNRCGRDRTRRRPPAGATGSGRGATGGRGSVRGDRSVGPLPLTQSTDVPGAYSARRHNREGHHRYQRVVGVCPRQDLHLRDAQVLLFGPFLDVSVSGDPCWW